MSVYYCPSCDEWFSENRIYKKDLNINDPGLPECLSDEDYCVFCGSDISDKILDEDEIITMLNERGVKWKTC